MAHTHRALALVAATALLISGCAGAPSLSTGSLFGSADAKEAEAKVAAAPVNYNTPTARALQTGTTAARAAKCGYNFDADKLKANFLASEAAAGTDVGTLGQLDKIYTTGYSGILKAIADKPSYCTDTKTAEIKKDLTRYLAGDFAANAPKQVAKQDDGGVFGSFFDGALDEEVGPKYGSDEWWEKQNEAVGR